MRKYLLTAAVLFLIFTARSQWITQNPGFTNDSVGFYEISIPDKNTAWAVCYDGWFGLLSGKPILDFTRTIDGGNTWIPGKVGSDRTLRFSNITAIDDQEAWVAMHKIGTFTPATGAGFDKGGGGVFHTIDGGLTWEHNNPGELFDDNSVPRFVHFKDRNHGIAMGDPNGGYFEVYITNNKGKKWKRVAQENLPAPLANEVGWISGYAVVGNTIWFGTSAGRTYKSVDFGKNWTVITVDPLPGTYVNEIAFLDDGLTGVAHLRGRGRTFVFSTTDGGITWTNYFQPPNWKNSRITAVPGTNAFISTSTHPNPLFTGSSISYDAGQTWTDLERNRQKAACRFFDATTGYAGGFYITGHPVLGVGGIYKSDIVFEVPAADDNTVVQQNNSINQSTIGLEKKDKPESFKVYPTPANDVINVFLENSLMNNSSVVSLFNIDGRLIESKKPQGSKLVQLNVSKLPTGQYVLRVTSKSQTTNKIITVKR
jgi:photosystem II stability/assembly factor-like uncharacterized protein